MNTIQFPRIKAGRGEKPETEARLVTLPKSALGAIDEVSDASFGGNFSLYIRNLIKEDLIKRGYKIETLSN